VKLKSDCSEGEDLEDMIQEKCLRKFRNQIKGEEHKYFLEVRSFIYITHKHYKIANTLKRHL